ncbi:putative competence-damage inducible protein [Sporosarcina sp. NCCP-2716]|uniref:competence/damage-inducible protein A n=1 Tax=Sporosarcina sp. NCCP-2716 TaxID=2943679 RepID=UPI00203E845E|nr:competence/damage-inducible protein A [Sporosarcina sp. NCCP-2716]GKV67866.1 putative competence-damage inducible protein [Sporosarcina sp. NCCP-2716]
MKAEIIAVGSELLLGQITNTNAKFISAQLAEIGIDVFYQTVVGDNPSRLEETIRIAESRADLIIFSGGLGPTKDDLTKETIAKHIGCDLEMDEEALTSIEAYFERTGRTMTDNNRKQALVLEGATVLVNRNGMAPGMAAIAGGRTYILLPGPPHEMEPMFRQEAVPYLQQLLGHQEAIISTVVKFFGIGEAELAARLQDLLDRQTNPTIAPLATRDAVTLRLTAKAPSESEARGLIAPVIDELRDQVGAYIVGFDEDTLPSKAADLLLAKGLTISAAESLTAGLFTSLLAEQPGISRSLAGGMTVYTREAKIRQLGVDPSLLDRFGIVSAECAKTLAEKVRSRFGTDIGVGLTGAAGPDPHDGEPAGTVWIGIAAEDRTEAYQLRLSGLRNTNRERAANYALYYLIRLLEH